MKTLQYSYIIYICISPEKDFYLFLFITITDLTHVHFVMVMVYLGGFREMCVCVGGGGVRTPMISATTLVSRLLRCWAAGRIQGGGGEGVLGVRTPPPFWWTPKLHNEGKNGACTQMCHVLVLNSYPDAPPPPLPPAFPKSCIRPWVVYDIHYYGLCLTSPTGISRRPRDLAKRFLIG